MSLDLLSIDLVVEPGRPTAIQLQMRCGIQLRGISVWRTPGGPRVVFPVTGGGVSKPAFAISSALRQEWTAAILDAWRRRISLDNFCQSSRRLRRVA